MSKRENIADKIAWIGCLGLPLLAAIFFVIYSGYKYVDENWFFADYTNFKVEEACKTGKLKRGIYSGDFTLYDQNSRVMDNMSGKVKIKDGDVFAVEYRMPGFDVKQDENIPTTVRITICGQNYDYEAREKLEDPLD
jgi:hypothetical protein